MDTENVTGKERDIEKADETGRAAEETAGTERAAESLTGAEKDSEDLTDTGTVKFTDQRIEAGTSTGMGTSEQSEQSGQNEKPENNEKTGKIDTVRKAISAIGCILMLASIPFPFLRMTEPNGAVTDMTRGETFAAGMPGWEAGPYIIWALIALSCALILAFHLRDQRKKSRHGCRLALLIVIFDVLTIAGFMVQYGPDDITFFPLAGFWLLAAGCLITWISSFLHRRKRKPKKNRKGKSRRKDRDHPANPDDPETEEPGTGEEGADSSGRSDKKLYREMKKQQKLEREERMRKAAAKRDDS